MPERPPFIKNVSELPDNGGTTWEGEVFSIRTRLSRPLGLVRLGVHHEVLKPGRRTSRPHAEINEEECVYVLEGTPHAWVDGELHPLSPDDIVVFAPGTGIRHTIVNMSDDDVRLLVVGERAALPRSRVVEFRSWLEAVHPEVERPEELPPNTLLALADEFEDGRVSKSRVRRESWCVAFIDHLYAERSADDAPRTSSESNERATSEKVK